MLIIMIIDRIKKMSKLKYLISYVFIKKKVLRHLTLNNNEEEVEEEES